MLTDSSLHAGDLDPHGVVAQLISSGRTLPSNWYTDDVIYSLEQRLIFRRAWQYVGHRGMVERVGD